MTSATRTSLTSTDRDLMVDFAMRWIHYGGGSAADIFVQFGVSDRVYFERLAELVDSEADMPDRLRTALRRLCKRRLDRKVMHSAANHLA